MGILKDSVERVHIQQERKRQFVLDRLLELGVKENEFKESIFEVEYKELLRLLVLAEMRKVDIDHPDHAWFR